MIVSVVREGGAGFSEGLLATSHRVGFARTPPVFLQEGDTVSVEIEKIGCLTNPVVAEQG